MTVCTCANLRHAHHLGRACSEPAVTPSGLCGVCAWNAWAAKQAEQARGRAKSHSDSMSSGA
jgi:hypothetical protein